LTRENIVVAVKNINIESRRMNLLIVAYEFSNVNVVSQWHTTETHQSDQVDGLVGVFQCARGVEYQWDAENSKDGVEDAHENVVEFFGISLSRFEFEGAIVASKVPRKANQHFAKRRMDLR
jgi:hypothetical protein